MPTSQPRVAVLSRDLDVCGPFLRSVVLSDVVQLTKDQVKVSGQVPNQQGAPTSERTELPPCGHEQVL